MNTSFDWRWIGAIAVIVLLTQVTRLPWFVMAGVLAAGGGYFLSIGWQTWKRSSGVSSSSRVTYWRGQRIEAAPSRRGPAMPRLSDIGPALIFLLVGGVMILAALSMIVDFVGLRF